MNASQRAKVEAYTSKLRIKYTQDMESTDSSEYALVCQHMLDVLDNIEYDFKTGDWDGKDACLYVYTHLYATISELADSAAFVKKELPHA